ncbi:MAG: hypothetical protein WBD40_01515 [Tepidisphaeraceae bacterium]
MTITAIARLVRIGLNVAASVSLLIALSSLVCWARSYWRCDTLYLMYWTDLNAPATRTTALLMSEPGRLLIGVVSEGTGKGAGRKCADHRWYWGWNVTSPPGRISTPTGPLGFGGTWDRITNGNWGGFINVVMPHWFMLLLALALPAWRFCGRKERLRRYRFANKLCIRCGYDLRAASNQCPECGAMRDFGPAQR